MSLIYSVNEGQSKKNNVSLFKPQFEEDMPWPLMAWQHVRIIFTQHINKLEKTDRSEIERTNNIRKQQIRFY